MLLLKMFFSFSLVTIPRRVFARQFLIPKGGKFTLRVERTLYCIRKQQDIANLKYTIVTPAKQGLFLSQPQPAYVRKLLNEFVAQ